MSHVVHLWQQPLPTSLAQAEAMLVELRQQLRVGPDPAAATLLAAIESALPEDGEAEDWWNEVPQADSRSPVLSLAPAVAELTTVLPAIESAARRLGWLVFDPQAGEVRLPSGPVLSRAGARLEAAPAVPMPPDLDESRTARKAWLHQSLAPVFTRRGWRALKGDFCFGKKYPWGQARVHSEMKGHDVLSHGVWLSLKLPVRLQSEINSDGGPELMVSLAQFAQRHGLVFTHDGKPGSWKGHVGYPTYKLPFAHASDARQCRDELLALYDGTVLDWMDTLTRIETLEHWANRVPDADCPFLVLRQLGHDHLLWHYHPDLLLAAAVEAPDLAQRVRERLALYEADEYGIKAAPRLRELAKVCGLSL